MIRVLNIIGKRPTGGIGAFVYNYQQHMNRKDIKIDYLLFDDEDNGAFDEKVKQLGSTVYVLPALKNIRFFLLWFKIDEFMKAIGKNYDIIHLHSVNIAFMCFPIAKKYGVSNLISHSHATVYSDKPINAFRNKILCLNLMKQANVYMACSKAAGEFLYGKENIENVIILNNAIECDRFKFRDTIRNEYRKKLDLENKFVIGNVGRFCEQKNQLFLIDIFLACLEKNANSELLLIGDGPMKCEVEDKVKKFGIENKVKFLGVRDDVDKILQSMDVFVLPSLFEGLPVIGVEAQASGLPLIISDTITRELNLGNVTYVSLDESPKYWAKKILECNLKIDRMVQYQNVSNLGYDIKKEANKLYEIYTNLCSKTTDKKYD